MNCGSLVIATVRSRCNRVGDSPTTQGCRISALVESVLLVNAAWHILVPLSGTVRAGMTLRCWSTYPSVCMCCEERSGAVDWGANRSATIGIALVLHVVALGSLLAG
jgi:hypothetical protein